MATQQREVIIISSGPSGYTAAIYLGRARLKPLLFSGQEIGGQLMYTTEVENFPGFPKGVEGPNLMMSMREQAERFETEIIDAKVSSVSGSAETGFIVVSEGKEYAAKSILIATGAKSRMLGLPEEESLIGRGLSTCAVCDAAFFREKVAYVIGGGDTAMEDTLALTKFAKEVFVIHRRDAFRASQIMQERVLNHPKVTVIWNSTVKQIHSANGMVSGITIENLQTGAQEERATDGLFYAIGHVPSTDFLGDFVKKNAEGYITTNFGFDKQSLEMASKNLDEKGALPFLTHTSTPGVFAAGDCVDFRYRQAVTAAAFGTMASLDVERWLETR